MTTLTVLQEVRELLAAEERWTKGSPARNKRGKPVSSTDKKAVCWCLNGALDKCAPRDASFWPSVKLLENILGQGFEGNYMRFNDAPDTTHKDVLGLLDKAIEKAK